MKNLIFILSIFIIAQSCNKSSGTKKIISEKFNCNKGEMQSAWYSFGSDEIIPKIDNLKDEFIIVVDTNLSVKNFISSHESYLRELSQTLDTSDLNLQWSDGWDKLTDRQKIEKVIFEKKSNKLLADSIHFKNNNNKDLQQVWIINNTNNTTTIQMQDGSYICVLQAKTKKGNWMPIQYWQFSDCGNSYYTKPFLPKTANSFITKLPNKGDYKTKLRYKLLGLDKFYYSNEFDGKINYCEFVEDKANYDEIRGKIRPHFKLDSLINIVNPPPPLPN